MPTLAIGAAGSSSWERCALGVPSLAICVAENQRELLRQLARHGSVYAPDGEPPLQPPLTVHLAALLGNEALRNAMSARGMDLVDARGAARVAAALRASRVAVRPAVASDCDSVHAWRNAPEVRAASLDAREIPLDDHRAWFERTMRSDDRHLLVGEWQGRPVGVVRFDVNGAHAEVSIFLAPGEAGRGLGPGLLRAGERWLAARRPEVASVRAQVLAANRPSRNLFELSGYRPVSAHYEKEIAA